MEKVCIYNRCSTEEESQKNALEVQAQESIEIASGFKDWVIVDQFVESQSGTSTKGRNKYMTMIESIEAHKYNVVMIKSIDRLVRNVKDWYIFLDCITRNNTKLYIYMDRKFYSTDDALVTGIKAILASEFSRELSKKIKNAHKRRQLKQSGLNITRPMFGWDKIDTNVYKINEEEADILREACNLLMEGMGFGKLVKHMNKKGVRSKDGNVISSTQWRKMVRAPRMYGTVILHTYEYDFDTKQRVNVPESEWIYIKDALPAIVTKEFHDELIQVLDARNENALTESLKMPKKIGRHALSGKIFCKDCGNPFRTATREYQEGKKNVWICSTYLTLGKKTKDNPDGCAGICLVDETLKNLIMAEYKKKLYISKNDNNSIIDETLKIIRKTLESKDDNKRIKQLRNHIDKLQKKQDKLLNSLLDGIISDEIYKRKNEQFEKERLEASEELKALEKEMKDTMDYEQRLLNIKKALQESNIIDEASKEETIKKIERIDVYQNGNVEVLFDKYKMFGCGNYGLQALNDMEDLYTIKFEYEHVSKREQDIIDMKENVSKYLEKHDTFTTKQISEDLKLSMYSAYTRLNELKANGKIEYVHTTKDVGFWRVTGSDKILEGRKVILSHKEIFDNIEKYIIEHKPVSKNQIMEAFDLEEPIVRYKLDCLRKQNKIVFIYDEPSLGHWYPIENEEETKVLRTSKEKVIGCLYECEYATINEIVERTELAYNTVRLKLRDLRKEGVVEYDRNACRGGAWYLIDKNYK